MDIGRATVVSLPEDETERRWRRDHARSGRSCTPSYGVTRDQMMARHKANHIQVAYAPDRGGAWRAAMAKATAFDAMGITTHLCGDVEP